jgi:hypothetical protein
MKQHCVTFILLFLLAGCANNNVWYKPSASTNEFNVDKYDCLQQAQQPSGTAVVGQHVGFASKGFVTNKNLYNSCMNAKGWSLQDSKALQKTIAQNSAASTDEKSGHPKHYASKNLEELKSNWSEEDKYAFDLGIAGRLGEATAKMYEATGHKTLSTHNREMTLDDICDSYKDSPEKLRGLHEIFDYFYMKTISPNKTELDLSDNLQRILSGASPFPLFLGVAYESGFINALKDNIPMTSRSERESNVPFTYYKDDNVALEDLHRAYEWGYSHYQEKNK